MYIFHTLIMGAFRNINAHRSKEEVSKQLNYAICGVSNLHRFFVMTRHMAYFTTHGSERTTHKDNIRVFVLVFLFGFVFGFKW